MDAPVTARCQCGQLSATCQGEPASISVCHCHDCQRRSGSAFAAQIRFPVERIDITGRYNSWSRLAGSGARAVNHFCPDCGSTLFYDLDSMPGLRAVAVGAFAGTALPQPWFSIYEERKLPWVEIIGDGIEHHD